MPRFPFCRRGGRWLALLPLAGGALLAARGVAAATLMLDPPLVDLRVGDQAVLTLRLESAAEEINAAAGTVTLPPGVAVREVRDAGSLINFWVRRPAIDSLGFSGVIPGGYQGSGGELFSLVVEGTAIGQGDVSIGEAQALKNDGSGSAAAVVVRPARLTVAAAATGDPNLVPAVTDTVPPEPFTPALERHAAVLDGRWFAAFATQDKGSGLARYEVAEFGGRRLPPPDQLSWRVADSPYPLEDQSGRSYVLVKAVDHFGNVWMGVVPPRVPSRSRPGLLWGMLGGVGVAVPVALWFGRRRFPPLPYG